MLHILKSSLKTSHFALIMSVINFVFFHLPFFNFVFDNTKATSLNGGFLIISLIILMILANFFAFYLFLSISKYLGKTLLILSFIINAIALYFANTYSVIIDESMIGNVFNTNFEESSGFFSFKLVLYVLLLGVLPCIYIYRTTLIKESIKRFFSTMGIVLTAMLLLAFANASNWLWIDKHSKQLGGLAMPWSYSVNTSLYYIHNAQKNKKEILLSDATIKNKQKAIVVLVIGESARRQNFSLYGYEKQTNPLLSKMDNLYHFDATSCATYTTAGVKCILEHQESNDLYEILPNYLYRNGVDVIWRTTNWGEPPVHIENYKNKEALKQISEDQTADYDQILLTGLKQEILNSTKDKIFIVLHTSTSHGPQYNKKYPKEFETFTPVCNSVELANCSQTELVNAYDNTIVYTDYILSRVIEDLKELKQYKSTMLFVSDHGESLGEKNLYMHGLPMSIAPKEQYEIPFIVWVSDNSKKLKPNNNLSQQHVFHSVMNFLSVDSSIYNEQMNIFLDK